MSSLFPDEVFPDKVYGDNQENKQLFNVERGNVNLSRDLIFNAILITPFRVINFVFLSLLF